MSFSYKLQSKCFKLKNGNINLNSNLQQLPYCKNNLFELISLQKFDTKWIEQCILYIKTCHQTWSTKDLGFNEVCCLLNLSSFFFRELQFKDLILCKQNKPKTTITTKPSLLDYKDKARFWPQSVISYNS